MVLEPDFRQRPERLETLDACRAALEAHYRKIWDGIITMPYPDDTGAGILIPPWVGAVEPLSGAYQIGGFVELRGAPVPVTRNLANGSTWSVATKLRSKRLCHYIGLDHLGGCIRALAMVAGVDINWPRVDASTSWSMKHDLAPLIRIGDLTPPPNGFSDSSGRLRIGAILRALTAPGSTPSGLSVRSSLNAIGALGAQP